MAAPAEHRAIDDHRATDATDAQLLSEDDLNRVYGALVRLPKPSREALLDTGLAADLVDRATLLLQARGLLGSGDQDRWDVPAPDIAITAWAADTERRARDWRAKAGQLHQLFLAARSHELIASANRELATLADIASATATITAAAKQEILSVRADSRRTQQLLLDPFNSHRELFRNAAGELVELRAVYDPAVLDVPGALEALRERVIGGEEIRLAGEIHFSAIVVDDVAAVVEFSNIETTGAGSMLLRGHPFVTAMRRLGESLFAAGTPLPMGDDGPPLDSASDRDALILSLLAAGASDSTITRRLGISQRTVERRVRHILDGLGAETRFQAGVLACRQGLV